jgi:glycosyltransferase involved in cell wall biosynthesis
MGKVAHDRMLELCVAADINVVTFMHAPLFYENSPNKFFDGIAAGLPTVFNRSTWLEPWLRAYDCGEVCKGCHPGAEMADVIRRLANDPERRKQMGRNARRLAEEVFGRDALAEKYLSIVEDIHTCGRVRGAK